MKSLDTFRSLKNKIAQSQANLDVPLASQSAILIAVDPFVGSEPVLLLTKRTQAVESHKGQVSFPGGFFESFDSSLLETALREFEEEVGGARSAVDVIGCLSPSYTHTNVPIIPWIGIINRQLDYKLNSAEVDRLLFLPVQRLIVEGLSPVSVQLPHARVWSVGIEVEGELVWGATARILLELKDKLIHSQALNGATRIG